MPPTRQQAEKAWWFVRDGRYGDAVIMRQARVSALLIKRMRGIRARLVREGRDPMRFGWLDVMLERPLKA